MRELDRQVAEALGHELKKSAFGEIWFDLDMPNQQIPHYSTSIADAWTLVEKTFHTGGEEPYALRIFGPLDDGYKVELIWCHHDGDIPLAEFICDTAPEAICKAFLKWKESK